MALNGYKYSNCPPPGFYYFNEYYGAFRQDVENTKAYLFGRNELDTLAYDFEKPNGVLGTPDGKILYVTDAQAGKTYKYDIQEDGSLANKTLFVEVGCDGMTIDKAGNVYLTTSGKDRNQLFITARTSIYRVELNTEGVD